MPSNTTSQEGETGSRGPAVRIYRPGSVETVMPAEKGEAVREIGGRKDGTDPTRYGDWEKHGRCIDF